MPSLCQTIMEARNIKENSCNTYISALRTIKKRLTGDNSLPTNIKFLTSHTFQEIMAAVNAEVKPTSRKNKLTAVIVAISAYKKPKHMKLLEKLGVELKQMNEAYFETLKEQKKTDSQKKNWITYADLINIVNQLMISVDYKKIKNRNKISNKQYNKLQQYLLLSTYLEFPLRNDFADMKIITERMLSKMSPEQKQANNFLLIKSHKEKKFLINAFKNKKFIGSKVLDIPEHLNKIINLSLKFNKSGYYLVRADRLTPLNPNDLTKYFNKLFLQFTDGKLISTSMIRHILISHHLKGTKTLKEKEDDEKKIENKYFHSNAVNQLYRKVD